MIVLKGAEVSAGIKNQVEQLLAERTGEPPKLAIIRVGEKPDDCSYERGATKKLKSFGLRVQSYVYPEDISDEEFKKAFSEINEDPDVTGILLLRPLPKQIRETDLEAMIAPEKDLDGISPVNIAKVFSGDPSGFAPCTAEAVVELLKHYKIPIEGKRVTIVGRSMVVGRPLSMLMLRENGTVTICHTRTKDLEAVCREADILVAAAGRAKLLDQRFAAPNAVVIDVGIHVQEDGTMCGDVDFASLEGTVSMATPVPGGVGAVTTAVLAKHLLQADTIRKRR